jgi:hypothetical protein
MWSDPQAEPRTALIGREVEMPGKSEQEVKREVEQRLKEIKLLKAQDKKLKFSSLSEDELLGKVRRQTAKSPYIYAQAWTSGTSIGAPASYAVYISNPDPTGYYPTFVSIFFGVANFLDDIAEALAGRDQRWPYLTIAPFSLASGATTTQTFNYTTPSGIVASTYLGNSLVWAGAYHDKGSFFDRGLFDVSLH